MLIFNEAWDFMTKSVPIEIMELTPDRLEDFLLFFDRDAFIDFPYWCGCYCGFYDTQGNEWDASKEAGPEHRSAKAELIKTGKSTGLLAYSDGKVVGWCNAQPRANFANMRGYQLAVDNPSEPVGSIMCFLVAPSNRGNGVGTILLAAACEMFKRNGFQIAEAYPTIRRSNSPSEIPWDEANYKGPLSMYLKAGFTVHRELERFAIVRKPI